MHKKKKVREGMGPDVNYLKPGILETTNRIIEDIEHIIQSECEDESKWHPVKISAYFFNKRNRTFHTHLVIGQQFWAENYREDLDYYSKFALCTNEVFSGIMYQVLSERESQVERSVLALLEADVVGGSDQGYPTVVRPWYWKDSYREIGPGSESLSPRKQIENPERLKKWEKLCWKFYAEQLLLALKRNPKGSVPEGDKVLLIPIYDVWNAGRGSGGLWGTLVCTFADEDGRNEYLNPSGEQATQLLDILLEVERLADAYFEAGLVKISREEIVPPYDWIELFVKRLHWIQDWDRVTVLKDKKIEYCYKHFANIGMIESEWCRCTEKNESVCNECRKKDPVRPVYTWSSIRQIGNDHPILNGHVITEIEAAEEANVKNIDIEFQFPVSAVVMTDEKGVLDRHVGLEIARQHVEVLRVLLPIIRRRRSALRSAVSAVMGRNMSHNIGSHVLARYSSQIRGDRDPIKKGHTDHRGDFLTYLQQRMDFIAEVSTSDRSHWVQSLSLKDALARLDYEAQRKRFEKEQPGKYGTPILLHYITGKETLTASVEYHGDDGLAFACPSGEIGLHALYIILENVIRNSARHGSPSDGKVTIKVEAKEIGQDEIELTIVDPGTALTPSGYVGIKRVAVPDGSDDKKVSVIEAALRASFLQDSGEPDPRNWGVREMQVCAQYLLSRPLSELEGVDAAEVLKPCVYTLFEGKHCLAYTLRLRKPKTILVLTEQLPVLDKEQYNALKSNGINCYDKISVKALSSNQRLVLRDFDFLIVEQDTVHGKVALVPPINLKDWGAGLDTLLCLRRVGMPKGEIEDLLKCNLDTALTRLHRCMAEQYSTERQVWHAPITSVVGWDNSQNPLPGDPPPDYLLREDIASEKGYRHIDTGLGDDTFVLLPFPEEIGKLKEPQRDNTESDICGIAWLDHANDLQFKIKQSDKPNENDGKAEAPYFAGAAVHCVPYRNTQGTSRWIAVEPMWSDSPHTATLKKIKNATKLSSSEWKAHAELVCAAMPRVVVLDERVQSRRFDKVRDVSLFKYWPHVGIWTPFKDNDEQSLEVDDVGKAFLGKLDTPRCDLDYPNLKEIQAFLGQPSPLAHQGDADFLVVHLTILEKLQQEMKNENRDFTLDQVFESLTAGTCAKKSRRIVVTGRGVPSQLRHNHHDNTGNHGDLLSARFVPVSAILEYLVQRPSKLGLMRVLWSA